MSASVGLPLAFRVVDRAGGALRSAGVPLIRLDERSLLGSARRAAGLPALLHPDGGEVVNG